MLDKVKGPARSLALAQVGARARRGCLTVEYQSRSQEALHSRLASRVARRGHFTAVGSSQSCSQEGTFHSRVASRVARKGHFTAVASRVARGRFTAVGSSRRFTAVGFSWRFTAVGSSQSCSQEGALHSSRNGLRNCTYDSSSSTCVKSRPSVDIGSSYRLIVTV